jgi:hypothetical protein
MSLVPISDPYSAGVTVAFRGGNMRITTNGVTYTVHTEAELLDLIARLKVAA